MAVTQREQSAADGATDLVGMAGDVLALLGDGVDAQVRVTRNRHGLTRFANGFVHQHVDEDTATVDVRMALDGRAVGAATTDLRPEALATFAADLRATAEAAPVDPGWAGFAPPDEGALPDERFDEATAANDPEVRADLVATFVAAGGDLDAAGYCDTQATEVGYVNSAGREQLGRMTRATLDGIHRTTTSSGSGHATAVGLAGLDAEAVGELARERAERGRDGVDVEPGPYQVVLGPEAVATILVFLSVYGFNAKTHREGQSAVRVNEAQFDPTVTIRDAVDDPRAIRLPFDAEGTPRRPVTLVAGGTSTHLAHDRRTAAAVGARSTGHAVDGGASWGTVPAVTLLEPGAARPDELVAAVDRGLYVAAFNYCRVLDPKTLVVTGLTRNGTFLVEDGVLSGPVSNLRFTQSFTLALGPGNVLGMADDARYADAEFGPAMAIAPSIRIDGFNVTGNARG